MREFVLGRVDPRAILKGKGSCRGGGCYGRISGESRSDEFGHDVFGLLLAGLPGVIAYKAIPLPIGLERDWSKFPIWGWRMFASGRSSLSRILQGAANGKSLSAELGQILKEPKARNKALSVSGKLRDILTQAEDPGAVDWLIESGALE